ncbi:MAG: type I-F CRISPR-associated protein Csy1 [Reinekea sp.]
MKELSTLSAPMTQLITSYIAERKNAKLEQYDKETASLLKKTDTFNKAHLTQERASQRLEVEFHFSPINWLTDAAKRAKQIQLATHAIKFTHSDAKGSSFYAANAGAEQSVFVSTASLNNVSTDVVGNAAALDVGKLLQLSEQSIALIDFIRENNNEPFLPFAKNEAQAQHWCDQFRQAVVPAQPSSHKLAKQLYWPVEDGYHLLSPLFATSLAQQVFETVQAARFSDESKAARDARKNDRYHPQDIVFYPNLAVQSFGGTQPQNISQLNSSRGGKSYLFNSAPPHWRRQNSPPLKTKSVFDGAFSRLVSHRLRELREFLKKHHDKASLSRYKNCREQMLEGIFDELLMYRIRLNHFEAGWSQNPDCQLPLHQQLWLDQGRIAFDQDFHQAYGAKTWQREVASDFARFLNHQLELGGKLSTSKADFDQWRVEVAQEIRLLSKRSQEDL